jgi:hypothetical protein
VQPARILVAHDHGGLSIIEKALHGCDLVVVTDMKKVEFLTTEDGIDCFVIGIHFDYSRAVELVTTIRRSEKHKTTPVILIRCSPSPNAQMLRSTVDLLIDHGTVRQYLELDDDPDAVEKIRAAVDECLAVSKSSKHSEPSR